MAITDCNEVSTRGGRWHVESGRTYTRRFQVVSNDVSEREDDILSYTSIPSFGDAHPGDSSALCYEKECKPERENRLYWEVVCRYRFVPGTLPPIGGGVRQPWEYPPQVRVLSAKYELAADTGWGKKKGLGAFAAADFTDPGVWTNPNWPIRNSAGFPFDPAVMRDVDHMVIQINRAEQDADVDLDKMAAFRLSVNSKRVTVCGVALDPLQGRLNAFDVTRQWTVHDNIPYYDVVYEIEVDKSYHTAKLIDQGFHEIVDTVTYPTDPKEYPTTPYTRWITDNEGNRLTEPSLLDGAGKKLDAGDGGGDPIFFQFLLNPAMDWNSAAGGLNLPVDMPS